MTREELEAAIWRALRKRNGQPAPFDVSAAQLDTAFVLTVLRAADAYATAEAAQLLRDTDSRLRHTPGPVHFKIGLNRVACRSHCNISCPMTREPTAVTCGACARTTAYQQAGGIPA